MKPCHLVFCGLVRNAEVNLRKNLERIEAIRPYFEKVSVIVFENDSSDGTKEVLQSYAARAEHVQVNMADYKRNPLDQGPYSRHRIDLMSTYRNQYLSALAELEAVDYVCVIDLDVFHFDIAPFLACFEDDTPWDVRSAFGINRVEYMWDYVFYDIYAYAELDNYAVLPFHNFEEFKVHQSRLYKKCRQANGLLPVGSNFNGLALYRAEAMLCGVKYASAEANVEGVGSLCEHVVLHAGMRERGYAAQFIDPRLVVTYLDISRWTHARNYLRFQSWKQLRRVYGGLRKAFFSITGAA